MTECILVDFDVTIQGDSAPYTVTARYGDAVANGEFDEAITDPWWQIAHAALDRSMRIPDVAAIRNAGSRLFRSLFREDVRDLWVAARAVAEQEREPSGRAGLRLRLDLQPPAVAALPWESLYDPRRNQAFAASELVTVVRVATLYSHVRPARRLSVTLPLGVVIAAPDDPYEIIDAPAEIAKIQEVVDSDLVETIPYTGQFSITQLRHFLSETKPAVLHFVGHGEPDGLLMWRRGSATVVSGASLGNLVGRVRSIKLAVLNACLAGQPDGRQPFGSVAMQMLQVGLPAVIAMQYAIRDDAAIDFAAYLYDSLVRGDCPGRIDLAMTAARADLYLSNPGDFSFGTPVLWLNERHGRVFSTDAAPEDTPGASATRLDLRAERRWLDQISRSGTADHLSKEFQFLAAKWRGLLAVLSDRLARLSALTPETAAYAAALTDYRRHKAAALRMQRHIANAAA